MSTFLWFFFGLIVGGFFVGLIAVRKLRRLQNLLTEARGVLSKIVETEYRG